MKTHRESRSLCGGTPNVRRNAAPLRCNGSGLRLARPRGRLLLGAVLLMVVGCAALGDCARLDPYPSRYRAELNADQVVDLMQQAGFTPEEILEIGADLRNALAIDGGARDVYFSLEPEPAPQP